MNAEPTAAPVRDDFSLMVVLSDVVWHVIVAALLALIPYLVISLIRTISRARPIHEFGQVPLLMKLSVFAGVLFAIVVLATQVDRRTIAFDEIFSTGGTWDVDFLEFITTRINPFSLDLGAMIDDVTDGGFWNLTMLAFVIAILALVCNAVVCFAVWYSYEAALASIASVLIALLTAYVLVYLPAALVWSMSQMNFAVLLAALFMLRPPIRPHGARG